MTRSLKSQLLALGSVAALVTGCSGGLDGGSITGTFIGIQTALVKGPETVEVNWETNSNCNAYKIYQLSSSTSDSISTVTVPPVKVKAPYVQSDHTYTFAVGCVNSKGDVSGLSYTKSASTWPKFNGVVTSTLDVTGTNPLVVLNWTYAAGTGTTFQVFASPSTVPGDLSTWGLTQPGGYGTQYTQAPICEVYDNTVKIGVGGNCSTASLVSGSVYNFKVVAKYPDNQYSSDIIGNGTSIGVPASFTPPDCILTKAGLGADSDNAYLFLRCSAGGAVTGGCSINNITTTAYQAVNGVRTVVSDTLIGAGTLRIAPKISTSKANDRLVENLEVEYTCKATTPYSKAIVRYDGTTTQYPKPFLKYGSTGYEAAPPQSIELHPSYLGNSVAVGDFNCDGKPDLAVGLPKISYNASPYLNQNAESGAVKIYYDYATSASGAITATSTQYLSFRDLGTYAHFGQSLSSGNLNKDVHVDGNGNIFSCDDLIIGAPGISDRTNYRGSAFVFYGQPQGFPRPLDSAGLAVNSPTCSGNISSEVCAPVKLQPNMTTSFKVDPNETGLNNGYEGQVDQIGFSVAYIRDFNADGYGDIAIGNPYCRWDGEAINNYQPPAGTTGVPYPPLDVGCVYVYWGGPQGLQSTYVGKTPNDGANLNSTFVKVYPPFPQDSMHFGWSISGGGDVDARLPVPVEQNGGPGIILANGNDFIVGAPDFAYTGDTREGTSKTLSWTVDESAGRSGCSGGTCPVDPVVMQGAPTYTAVEAVYGAKITPPWNGAWSQATTSWNGSSGYPVPSNANLKNSRGIAFLYLGRSAHLSYDLSVISDPSGGAEYYLYPNQAATAPSGTTMNQLFTNNLRDRQNGSQYLTTKSNITWLQAPTDSFYNCGPRGGPLNPNGSGYYKHLSCLAGRNNFSVIYPTSGSAAVSFGKNLTIAGAAEQNAVALYQLGSFITAAGYKSVLNANNYLDLLPMSLGNVHDRVRGTSLWELGIKGLNTPGVRDTTCEVSIDTNSSQKFPGSCSASYTGRLARSMLDESYSFPSSSWNPAPSATPVSDINKDGYADVLVTANSQLYTYFGNYAADFSYQVNSYVGSAGCAVTRKNTINNQTFSTNVQPLFTTGTPAPYATFTTRSAGLSSVDYQITGEYPQFVLPSTGNNVRAAYLDDLNQSSSVVFSYPTSISRSNGFGAACLPQVKSFANTPTSLTASDINGDGTIDAVIGFSGANSASGLTIASIAGPSGNGLALDNNYTVSASSAKFGTSAAALNWKFMDETSRRDLFVGATGYSSGSGSVYAFSAANASTMTSVPSAQILETANAPNLLGAEYAKIIGDINGDGYEDIWMPVKRIDASGSVYYDALIYYGSSFGPITYTTCMAKLGSISILGGSNARASDCLGTASPQIGVIDTVQVRLPQYVSKPTGVSNNWALAALPAGDVNRDGYQDLMLLDIRYSSTANMYLFFGSGGGLINGQPIMGPSLNQSPQLVTSNTELVGNNGPDGYNGNNWGAGHPSWDAITAFNFSTWNVPQTNLPIVHGDFNGDGFEDIAFAQPTGDSPKHDVAWTCYNGQAASDSWCNTSPTPEPAGAYDATAGNAAVPGTGYVVVMYGGSGGYQTPVNAGTGLAQDFPTIGETCSDLYATCIPNSASRDTYIRSVYNTLTYDGANGTYSVDTSKTACDPNSPTASNPEFACKGQFIRNPIFYNDTVNGKVFSSLRYMVFGSTMTVMDANHDGIDDLVIGSPRMYEPGWAGRFGVAAKTIFGSTANDTYQKGELYVYYGSKGAGVVAPDGATMLGDLGMGLDGSTNMLPKANTAVFHIYPMYANAGLPATFPELDRDGANGDVKRNFATGTTSGDFNGDGYDDLAVVSGNGQIYVYYGPICQVDNTKTTWRTVVYANHNKACLTNTGGVAGVCGTAAGTIGPNDCTQMNLNMSMQSNFSNPVALAPQSSKPLYPQMIYVTGSSSTSAMGSALMAKRPLRAPASTAVIKNPGNINGDPEGTSDLVVGTYFMNDPNVLTGTTGLGYIYFGHKTPTAGEMPSLPGLYTTGSASYNGGITSSVVGGNTYYFYTPVLLKPHTADGNTGSFFMFGSSMGDINGDGTGDIVLPTREMDHAADNSPVISGGGLKLFY